MSDQILHAKDVIKPEFYEEYVKTRDAIQNHLTYVYTNMYILKKIVTFPWKLFPLPHNEKFWFYTTKNYYDSMIVALSALLFDSKRPDGKESLSLNRFKNQIFLNVVNESSKKEIQKRLKVLANEGISLEKNEEFVLIKEQIKNIRNTYLAHLDHANLTGINLSVDMVIYPLPLSKVEFFLDAVMMHFETLCFEKIVHRTVWGYSANLNFIEIDDKSDIDHLLNYTASQSYYLRKSEYAWEREKQETNLNKLSSEDRAIVEYWRERVEKDKNLR